MSAAVLGKRSLYDDFHSPPSVKRIRGCGTAAAAPLRLASASPPRSGGSGGGALDAGGGSVVAQLRAVFPHMDAHELEKVLAACGNDLDSAIRSLNGLRLSAGGCEVRPPDLEAPPGGAAPATGSEPGSSSASSKQDPKAQAHAPDAAAALGNAATDGRLAPRGAEEEAAATLGGREWVELVVTEMAAAVDLDDARARAARLLEAFERTVAERGEERARALQKALGDGIGLAELPAPVHPLQENAALKEHLQSLLRDTHVLKRAVAIQHERQQEHEHCAAELAQLKQAIAQYQDQLRTLEVSNYALSMHLRQAQDSKSSMPGRFHPDVF
eukprot:SM000142S00500  [mRNA]  locus=s142:62990:64689:+ [translate_table: standard]